MEETLRRRDVYKAHQVYGPEDRRPLFPVPPSERNDPCVSARWVCDFLEAFEAKWSDFKKSWYFCGEDGWDYDPTPYSEKLTQQAVMGLKEAAAMVIRFEGVWRFTQPLRANDLAKRFRETARDIENGGAIDPSEDLEKLGWEIEDAATRESKIRLRGTDPNTNRIQEMMPADGKQGGSGSQSMPSSPAAMEENLLTASQRRMAERKTRAREMNKNGLTNSQIAIKLGVSEATVSRDLKESRPQA